MSELDHPCRDTCSGWRQGFEKGRESMRAKIDALEQHGSAANAEYRHWRGKAEREYERSAKLIEALKFYAGLTISHDAIIIDDPRRKEAIKVLAEYKASK